MIRRKEKGSKAERELVTMFWNAGWAAIRVAGSGLTKKPNPDVIAGNGIRRIAVECKTTKQIRKYLTREDVNQLIEFSRKFGAEPWFGIRINNMKWYFIGVEELEQTEKGYVITIPLLKRRGLLFEQLIK